MASITSQYLSYDSLISNSLVEISNSLVPKKFVIKLTSGLIKDQFLFIISHQLFFSTEFHFAKRSLLLSLLLIFHIFIKYKK